MATMYSAAVSPGASANVSVLQRGAWSIRGAPACGLCGRGVRQPGNESGPYRWQRCYPAAGWVVLCAHAARRHPMGNSGTQLWPLARSSCTMAWAVLSKARQAMRPTLSKGGLSTAVPCNDARWPTPRRMQLLCESLNRCACDVGPLSMTMCVPAVRIPKALRVRLRACMP